MKKNTIKPFMPLLLLLALAFTAQGQQGSAKQGHLFIIGGGERSSALIREMVVTANLGAEDYILILPMATSIPEESVAYISTQLAEHSTQPIYSFNFTRTQASEQQSWIDSVANARLIYITGGDQNKFMDVVRGTKLFDALHQAYQRGATIAGTSAGAAIMSQEMITGSKIGEHEASDFREIKHDYAATATGMGFISDAIIDQHFIMRSRHNRLLSLLADYPDKTMIGIDEGTAIIVSGNRVRVVGDSQVLVVSQPQNMHRTSTGKAAFNDANLSLYIDGQSFNLK